MQKALVFVFTSALAISLVGCSTADHRKPCEYKIIRGRLGGHSSTLPPLEKQLEDAASEGWEVVSSSGGDPDSAMIILKRQK